MVDEVTKDTAFGAMTAMPADYVPVGGTGFWKADANFFDSARSRKWDGTLREEDLALYRERMTEWIPDAQARNWLENGGGQALISYN